MPVWKNLPSAGDGVKLLSLPDSQFKTKRVAVSFYLPLAEESASATAILPFLLSHSCREYPNVTLLNERLASLYGAKLFGSVDRLGESQVLTISLFAIGDEYTPANEPLSRECVRLLRALLFDPVLEDGCFPASSIEQEKRCLKELMEAEQNDKRTYAKNRCEQIMCRGEGYGINKYGSIERVAALTPADVTEAWRQLLKSARVCLSFLGMESDGTLEEAFAGLGRREPVVCQTQVVKKASQVKEVTERLPVSQAKLVMGFRTGTAEPEPEVMATRIMVALLGGTAHSKFFLNVREKLHLCYYCSSRFDRHKGVMVVESGIEQENFEKAKEEILRQIQAVQAGEFTDAELSATVLSIQNSFRTVSDRVTAIASWYENQYFDADLATPEESAAAAAAVAREQVIAAANRLTLDTVYLLTGEEEGQ